MWPFIMRKMNYCRNMFITLYSLFIYSYPVGETVYGEILDLCATLITMSCLILLFKYYNQIPVCKTTILVYITKLLLCTMWIPIIRSATLTFFVNIYKAHWDLYIY